jgi:hypothetical protein
VAGLLFGKILIWPLSRIVGALRNVGLLGGSDEATAAQDLVAALAWSIRGSVKVSVPDRIVHICMDMFNGLGAVLTAGFLFHLFGLPPSVVILLILAAWQVFFIIAYRQSFRASFGDLTGIVIGWFVVRWLF